MFNLIPQTTFQLVERGHTKKTEHRKNIAFETTSPNERKATRTCQQPTTTRKRREHADTRRHIHADDPNLLFTYFLYFAYFRYEDINNKYRKRREKIRKNESFSRIIPTGMHERNYSRHVTNDVLTFIWDDIVVERNLIGRCRTSIFQKELPHVTTSPCTKKSSKNWPVV